MKIYLSGLIAAGGTLSPDEVRRNCDRFDVAAAWLRSLGHEVVNPVELDDPRERLATVNRLDAHHDALRRDLRALLDCDGIYMLPEWIHSTGAPLELTVARGVGMTAFGDDLEFEDVRGASV